jgi:hypothetical protein
MKINPCALLIALGITAPAGAQTISEFLYQPSSPSFPVVVEGQAPYPAPPVWLHSANAVGVGYTWQAFPASSWTGQPWTGLAATDPNYQQQATVANGAAGPGLGATTFQINGQSVGMHLNTFGMTFARPYTNAALQFAVRHNNPWLWTGANASRLLCMSGLVNIATSYSAGSTNQALATFFTRSSEYGQLVFNALMFEQNPTVPGMQDQMHLDNAADTGLAIAISYMRTQSTPAGLYTSTVPGYGAPLLEYSTGTPPGAQRHFGFCISPTQFAKAITDANTRLASAIPPRPTISTNLSSYFLETSIVSPEIESANGRGHLGMTLDAMYVYRLIP